MRTSVQPVGRLRANTMASTPSRPLSDFVWRTAAVLLPTASYLRASEVRRLSQTEAPLRVARLRSETASMGCARGSCVSTGHAKRTLGPPVQTDTAARYCIHGRCMNTGGDPKHRLCAGWPLSNAAQTLTSGDVVVHDGMEVGLELGNRFGVKRDDVVHIEHASDDALVFRIESHARRVAEVIHRVHHVLIPIRSSSSRRALTR